MAANDGEHPVTDPGIPGVMYPAGTGAQGSSGAQPHPGGGGGLGQVAATRPFDSVQEPGTVAMATQGFGSTAPGANDPNYEAISAITSPVKVTGNVITPHHPNAGR